MGNYVNYQFISNLLYTIWGAAPPPLVRLWALLCVGVEQQKKVKASILLSVETLIWRGRTFYHTCTCGWGEGVLLVMLSRLGPPPPR